MLEKTAPHTNPVHAKLIADMMTFSGDANAFNISGFQDMNKITAVSSPFTEASFKVMLNTFIILVFFLKSSQFLKLVLIWFREAVRRSLCAGCLHMVISDTDSFFLMFYILETNQNPIRRCWKGCDRFIGRRDDKLCLGQRSAIGNWQWF